MGRGAPSFSPFTESPNRPRQPVYDLKKVLLKLEQKLICFNLHSNRICILLYKNKLIDLLLEYANNKNQRFFC